MFTITQIIVGYTMGAPPLQLPCSDPALEGLHRQDLVGTSTHGRSAWIRSGGLAALTTKRDSGQILRLFVYEKSSKIIKYYCKSVVQ